MRKKKVIEGLIVDPVNESIFPGRIYFTDRIKKIEKLEKAPEIYILPGFIDAHIHIESSMLTPSRFAELAVPHGTVAVVADPHEIANVLGVRGIDFMIEDAKRTPLRFYFTAPSCVPATSFETAGAKLGPQAIRKLLQKEEMVALAEMMNFPGVINGVPEVMKKIEIAKRMGKPVDGHAPGLQGEELLAYIKAGISTDHECLSLKEAMEKAEAGMKIMVREGSSAKDLKKLLKVAQKHEIFLVSDDLHPDDLKAGHIDSIIRKAVNSGMETFKALRAVTSNPSQHYRLPTGRIREGMYADFVITDSSLNFNVREVWIGGKCVAKEGKPLFKVKPGRKPNVFRAKLKKPEDFRIKAKRDTTKIKVIEAIDRTLFTKARIEPAKIKNGFILPDEQRDILKIAVVERYNGKKMAVGFIKGFGLKKGAIASSVAHDSHNIIGVGTDDTLLAKAINEVIKMKGGLAAVSSRKTLKLPLPIGGLMSDEPPEKVIKTLESLNKFVKKNLKSTLHNPFGTLSFMALLVIPELKISDRGLFDSKKFEFTSVIL